MWRWRESLDVAGREIERESMAEIKRDILGW